MLQAPAFVDALENKSLAETSKIGGVIHADFDSFWELGHECSKKRGT